MTTRIRIAGVEAKLDSNRHWNIVQRNGSSASLVRSIERFLNQAYGVEWEPAFGVYEPSLRNASAQAVAIDLGAEVLELDPVEDGPADRVY